MSEQAAVRLLPLGGIGQFGGNCLLIQDTLSQQAIVVDCGIRFLHDDEAPGFDFALPQFDALEELGEHFLGYIITHGHLDHIGALPFFYPKAPKPIYATRFTSQLISRRMKEHRIDADINEVTILETAHIGPFKIQWVSVNHSIPDATLLLIETPAGRLIHSGDFRNEQDPLVGPPTDLETVRRFSKDGTLCLIADSTSVSRDGPSAGERAVIPALAEIFQGAPGRLVLTTFSNHIQRMAAVLELCERFDRYLCFIGRSMLRNVDLARAGNMLPHAHRIISTSQLNGYLPRQVCVLMTGCQGEPNGSIGRLARQHLPQLHLEPSDRVVFSSRAIPGNERAIAATMDAFSSQGVQCYDGSKNRHVSGHGSWEDLRQLIEAAQPANFVAAHGGHTQLLSHRIRVEAQGKSIEDTSVKPFVSPRIVALQNGQEAHLRPDDTPTIQDVPEAHVVYTQGLHHTHQGPRIAQVRSRMKHAGVLVVWNENGTWRLITRGLPPGFSSKDRLHLCHLAQNCLSETSEEHQERFISRARKYFRVLRIDCPEVIIAQETPKP